MDTKHSHKYNLDEIINRFNQCPRNNIEKVRKLGYEEEFNESDIYNVLINLDITTGFFKVKSFIQYLREIPQADIIIEIKRTNPSGNKIAFKGIAYSYTDWIKDPNNLRYLTLLGHDGFYVYGNIRIVRWNHYNGFCFMDSLQQRNRSIEVPRQFSGRNSLNSLMLTPNRTSMNFSTPPPQRASMNSSISTPKRASINFPISASKRNSINLPPQDPNKILIENLRRSLNEDINDITPESSDVSPIDL